MGANSKKYDSMTLGVNPGGNPWDKVLCLGEPYQTSPHDLKSVFWFKSYSILSTKLVLKRYFLWIFEKIQKMTSKLHKTSYAALREAYLMSQNKGAARTYQTQFTE